MSLENYIKLSGNETEVARMRGNAYTTSSNPLVRIIMFFVKITKVHKNQISDISRISGKWETQISNVSWMGEHRKSSISNISSIIENNVDSSFQYFQDRNK